ncbi:MAG: phosphotransferase [Pseudomonadota bacterium]
MDSHTDQRALERTDFLAKTGWDDADCMALGQDASTRRYFRLKRGDDTALLMDAPRIEDEPCPPDADEATRHEMGWNATSRLASSRVDAFTSMSDYLVEDGLSAPKVYASDWESGFAILEDFGDGREFARLIERGEEDELKLYKEASKVLVHFHRRPAPTKIGTWPVLDYDRLALEVNAHLFAEWLPQHDDRFETSDEMWRDWTEVRDGLIAQALELPRNLILRDYHAENLLWLPDREGLARVGLIDFQDAINGWDGWELAMLVQDARRDVSNEAHDLVLRTYAEGTGKDEAGLRKRLAICGTLNALRITGLFARLQERDKKPRYGLFMPRQQYLLAENLKHPALADMARFVRTYAPFIFDVNP